MIRLVYSDYFLASVKQLPIAQQKKLARLLPLLAENPFHPMLHSKRLAGSLAGIISFRVTRDWRVLFQFFDETNDTTSARCPSSRYLPLAYAGYEAVWSRKNK
jgi:mRNA-degrading endonuclease RelE of RelBE toxin-antitoxin system